MRHVIVPEDLSATEIEAIFAVSRDLQEKFVAGRRDALLPGRVLALVFEKPSLRTRVSFEAAMTHLGGSSLFLGADSGFASSRESVADFGRVLSEYVDVIVCRSKSHDTIVQLADVAEVPVINGLSDYSHPCQALADLYTLRQHVGRVTGLTMAFVGDGNNVARSLAVLCGLLGMRFVLAAPQAYQFDAAFRAHLAKILPQADIAETTDPVAAVTGAAAVYTDVWASMGQEGERQQRLQPHTSSKTCCAESWLTRTSKLKQGTTTLRQAITLQHTLRDSDVQQASQKDRATNRPEHPRKTARPTRAARR